MKKVLMLFGGLFVIIALVVTYNITFSANYREPDIKGVEISVITNEHHTNEAMTKASDALIEEFKESFKGCTLTKIYYNELEDKYLDKKYKDESYSEVVVLLAEFNTDGRQEVLDLNKTYKDYKFVIVRKTDDSEYRVIDSFA